MRRAFPRCCGPRCRFKVVKLELTKPRGDVASRPFDTRLDDVDPDVATGRAQRLRQFDRVTPNAAAQLEDGVVGRNRRVMLVLLHVAAGNDLPCFRAPARHPREVDRNIKPAVAKHERVRFVHA